MVPSAWTATLPEVLGTCFTQTMKFILSPPYFSRLPEITICCTWLIPS